MGTRSNRESKWVYTSYLQRKDGEGPKDWTHLEEPFADIHAANVRLEELEKQTGKRHRVVTRRAPRRVMAAE